MKKRKKGSDSGRDERSISGEAPAPKVARSLSGWAQMIMTTRMRPALCHWSVYKVQ